MCVIEGLRPVDRRFLNSPTRTRSTYARTDGINHEWLSLIRDMRKPIVLLIFFPFHFVNNAVHIMQYNSEALLFHIVL